MSDSIAFTDARLVDGTGDDPVTDATVVVEGGEITASGPSEGISPDADRTVSLGGRTIMPGLIDAHLHLTLPETLPFHLEWADMSPAEHALRAADAAQRCVQAGFTTVRDVGATSYIDVDVRESIARGDLVGPRVLASGPGICQTGGHGNYEPPWLTLPAGSISEPADGTDGIRVAVRERLERHVDNVKTFLTGGASDAAEKLDTREFTDEEIAALYDESHAANKPVAAHCMTPDPCRRAMQQGLSGEHGDTVEHGIFFHRDTEVLDLLAENDVPLIPTLTVYRCMADGLGSGVPEEAALNAKESREDHVKSVQAALDAGVTVACGTDMGGPQAYHGENAQELVEFVEAGMSPLQAITAATRDTARALGIEDTVGTLEPGKEADLLVVDGDPTDDVRVLRRTDAIELVMRGGDPVSGHLELL
ncbi:metal-dependent hydrolase family protein [Halobellus salinisoli]|uniref:metal-dependent hydrolase family protein n=1 Tax=Halobellus salinisoli TaxID=3108500 RepID=UPI003009FE8B